jgi:hypothetical protein
MIVMELVPGVYFWNGKWELRQCFLYNCQNFSIVADLILFVIEWLALIVNTDRLVAVEMVQ